MIKRTKLLTVASTTIALLVAVSSNAQDRAVSSQVTETSEGSQIAESQPGFSPVPSENQVIANADGVAIDGFDPVAYFDEGQAVKGVEIHSCEYLNRTWHFSSAENRDKFLSNPEKFSPQYGGFCAHSLGRNKLIASNPQAFSIRDDKLYLYANKGLASKDAKRDDIKFKFNKTERDNNWFTYQSDF